MEISYFCSCFNGKGKIEPIGSRSRPNSVVVHRRSRGSRFVPSSSEASYRVVIRAQGRIDSEDVDAEPDQYLRQASRVHTPHVRRNSDSVPPGISNEEFLRKFNEDPELIENIARAFMRAKVAIDNMVYYEMKPIYQDGRITPLA